MVKPDCIEYLIVLTTISFTIFWDTIQRSWSESKVPRFKLLTMLMSHHKFLDRLTCYQVAFYWIPVFCKHIQVTYNTIIHWWFESIICLHLGRLAELVQRQTCNLKNDLKWLFFKNLIFLLFVHNRDTYNTTIIKLSWVRIPYFPP